MGWRSSEEDEEDAEEESLAIAEGLSSRSRERRLSFCWVSVDLREVSRLRWAKEDCLS